MEPEAALAEQEAYAAHTRELAKRYPEVLEAHAQFGGEIPEMLRLYAYEGTRQELATLRSDNERLGRERDEALKKLARCDWYWPEDDTSSEACNESPWEIVESYTDSRGQVVAVSRGGVIETRFYASLPAAEDSDSDDNFDVNEATEAEASAKIASELARRAALTKEPSK